MIRSASRRSRSTSGFTLVEVLTTAIVLGTAFIAASWSMTATARTKAAYENAQTPASFLAREIHELAAGLPRSPAGATGATSFSEVVALDCLEGASFSPPILADGTAPAEFSGWSQTVDLSVYSLDDLSTPTADDPADGLPPDASKLYRLDVQVFEGEEQVGTFQWWITP